jgi:hypothetical protein
VVPPIGSAPPLLTEPPLLLTEPPPLTEPPVLLIEPPLALPAVGPTVVLEIAVCPAAPVVPPGLDVSPPAPAPPAWLPPLFSAGGAPVPPQPTANGTQASSTKTKEWTFCDIFMTSPQVMRQSEKAVNCTRLGAQLIRIDEGMYLARLVFMRYEALLEAGPLAATGAKRS